MMRVSASAFLRILCISCSISSSFLMLSLSSFDASSPNSMASASCEARASFSSLSDMIDISISCVLIFFSSVRCLPMSPICARMASLSLANVSRSLKLVSHGRVVSHRVLRHWPTSTRARGDARVHRFR